jgi:hypothetical protein
VIAENLKTIASKLNFLRKTDILRKWRIRSQNGNIDVQSVQLQQCSYCQHEVYKIGMEVSSIAS